MRARAVAFGAIYSALSLIFLIFSAVFGNDLFLLMLSSLPMIVVIDRMGLKTGLFSYFTIIVLSFLLFPMRPSVIAFAVIFGPYTFIRSFVQQNTVFKTAIRWCSLAGLSAAAYGLFGTLAGIDFSGYAKWTAVALLAAALILYERLAQYFTVWYPGFLIRFSDRGR